LNLPEKSHLQNFSLNNRLPALPVKIRLGRMWLTVANTLAYYDTSIITVVKSVTVQALI
jgi:hypothetical protein